MTLNTKPSSSLRSVTSWAYQRSCSHRRWTHRCCDDSC